MTSGTEVVLAAPAKSAMAIGYWVAPTPEMSTRSCAWAAGAAATASARPRPAEAARRQRRPMKPEAVNTVMVTISLVVHAVVHVNIRRILAARRFREGRAGQDPLVDGIVETGIARGSGQIDSLDLAIGTQTGPEAGRGIGRTIAGRHVVDHAGLDAGAHLGGVAVVAAAPALVAVGVAAGDAGRFQGVAAHGGLQGLALGFGLFGGLFLCGFFLGRLLGRCLFGGGFFSGSLFSGRFLGSGFLGSGLRGLFFLRLFLFGLFPGRLLGGGFFLGGLLGSGLFSRCFLRLFPFSLLLGRLLARRLFCGFFLGFFLGGLFGQAAFHFLARLAFLGQGDLGLGLRLGGRGGLRLCFGGHLGLPCSFGLGRLFGGQAGGVVGPGLGFRLRLGFRRGMACRSRFGLWLVGLLLRRCGVGHRALGPELDLDGTRIVRCGGETHHHQQDQQPMGSQRDDQAAPVVAYAGRGVVVGTGVEETVEQIHGS